MIKIQAIKQDTTDTVSLSDSILTLNGVEYDLDSLIIKELAEGESQAPVYTDGADTYITIQPPHNRLFMFHSGNLYRFFDIDSNGIIDKSELKTAIDYINETDDDILKGKLKAIRDKYLETHSKEEWMAKGV